MNSPELNDATKQRLAQEVERLVRMGMDRKKARRIVWDDYQEELAAFAVLAPPEANAPQLKSCTPNTTASKPPTAVAPVSKPAQAAPIARFFTPERLQKSQAELAKVKRLIGLRSET